MANLGVNIEGEDVLRFQIHRQITNLSRNFLIVLEDLGMDHDTAMKKLHENLPEEYKNYVELADYFDETKYKNVRKKVLDGCGDSIRNLDETLKQFEIKIK